MTFLMFAANAASASEAFVTQLAHEVAATEATAVFFLNAASASTLAALLAPAIGKHNLSAVVQHGAGNQAIVTQHQGGH